MVFSSKIRFMTVRTSSYQTEKTLVIYSLIELPVAWNHITRFILFLRVCLLADVLINSCT